MFALATVFSIVYTATFALHLAPKLARPSEASVSMHLCAAAGKVSPRLSPGQAVSPNSKAPAAAVVAAALVNGASPRIWR